MSTLKVPGATLYYEVRGNGPTLLLICGGVYDADLYAPLAEQLADAYTVVTYDRRGNSRSPLDGPPELLVIGEHAEDAARLLTAVSPGAPAYVFGNSSGATFGLELTLRHPSLVHTVVAHEAPIFSLLPTADYWRGAMDDVERTFAAAGPGAAMGVFGGAFAAEPGAVLPPPPSSPPDQSAASTEMPPNMAFFVGYEVPPVGRYEPDLAALKASPARIVVAVGADSAAEAPHRAGLALAERLGLQPLVVPGDHGGFGSHPEAFAAALRPALA